MFHIIPIIAGEDAAVVLLTHRGATTLLDGSWGGPEEAPPLGNGGVVLEGRDGSMHLDQSAGELRHITNEGTTVLEHYPPRSIQAAFDNCIGDFAAGVRWGGRSYRRARTICEPSPPR